MSKRQDSMRWKRRSDSRPQPHMPTREDRRRRYWQALAVDRRPVLGRDIVSVKAAGWWAGADRRGDIDWRLALIVPERKISHDRRRWVRGSPNVVRSNLRYRRYRRRLLMQEQPP